MQSIVWNATQLISSLVLPPGVFFVLLAIGLWQGPKRRWAQWLAIGSLVAFVLASLPVVAYLLLRPFETAWPPLDPARLHGLPKEESMIVVLGGGRTLGAIEFPEHEALSSASLERSRYGVKLAKGSGLPLGVSGGKPGGGEISEGALMQYLIENELRHPVTVVEDRSFDTRQSAQFMANELQRLGKHTVVLVTDVVHMPRAARAFQSAGLQVIPAPMNFCATAPLRLPDFLPSVNGLKLSRYVLHELIGEAWYRWRRTIDMLLSVQTEERDPIAVR